MALGSQNRPESAGSAPDPSHNYERAHPQRESAHGKLDQPAAPPHEHPDHAGPESTSRHTNRPNSDSMGNSEHNPLARPGQPDHSMKEEEPMGWDQAPTDIANPRMQRLPRTDGKGGVE